jgi:transcriptional regulator with XRE-family HTH domain
MKKSGFTCLIQEVGDAGEVCVDLWLPVGPEIRAGRIAAGLTQRELGIALGGVSKHDIASMEHDRIPVDRDMAGRLAGILRQPASKFFHEIPPSVE